MMAGSWEWGVSQVLMRYGVAKEPLQHNAAEELESTLQDYHDLAQQYSQMLTDFCYAERPVRKDGIWLCPKCGRRIQQNHTHCHWCGKKVGWEAGRIRQGEAGEAQRKETGHGKKENAGAGSALRGLRKDSL